MLQDVLEQLEKKFLIKPIRFEGIHRIEELEYPVPALREMLLNALVHRNYLGSMTQLKVYHDKLTLWNAGTLPEELTFEKLLTVHESIPRNPLIAETCYKAGYIDSWGRGIEKITEACKEVGLPLPVFGERSGGVLVTLLRSASEIELSASEIELSASEIESSASEIELSASEIESSVSEIESSASEIESSASEIESDSLSENMKKMLSVIQQDSSITIENLAKFVGLTSRSVERNLKKLQEKRIIQRIGGTRGYWKLIKVLFNVGPDLYLQLNEPNVKFMSKLGNELGDELGNRLGNEWRFTQSNAQPTTQLSTKEKILHLLTQNPKMSGTSIAEHLKISTTAVEKHLKQLREDGLLKRVGGTRGHWEVV
jgi:ATP-dependent DNA helicase RecG